jgi:aspartyl-tRNA(Asn)/glutamyl-tRNA(Gln) amidotransferase subunit C
MAVTLHDVEHVALLAKLSFSEEEKVTLMDQLNTILRYMDRLNELDTSVVEPLAHVIDLRPPLRDDTLRPGLSREEALQNGPEHTDTMFRVPKVISER